MNPIRLIPLCLLFFTLACSNKKSKEINEELTFGDFVDFEKLEEVTMTNNSGTFELTEEQVLQIKDDLKGMTYDPNISVKVGAIAIKLKIDGEDYYVSTRTHGEYVEVHKNIVTNNKSSLGTSDWLYFKTNGVNFDNYKNENK